MRIIPLFLLLLVASFARAANPAFGDFNTNQFNTANNKVAVKSGPLLTNSEMHGVRSSDGTPGADAITGGVTFKDGFYTGGAIFGTNWVTNAVSAIYSNSVVKGTNINALDFRNGSDIIFQVSSGAVQAVSVTGLVINTTGSGGLVRSNAPNLHAPTLDGTNLTTQIDAQIDSKGALLLQSATNYANGVTNSSIVRQAQADAIVQSVTNYANGVTNSSLVRQVQANAIVQSVTNYTDAQILAKLVASNGNWVASQSGKATNLTTYGVTMPTLTASRALVLNSSGNPTNATGTADATHYLDGTGAYSVPAGGGGSGIATNANQFGASTVLTLKDGVRETNAVLVGVTSIGNGDGTFFYDAGGGDFLIGSNAFHNSFFSLGDEFKISAPSGLNLEPLVPGESGSTVSWGSTNGNGLGVTLQSDIVYSNLTLLWPTNGFAGIADPVMVVDPASISGVGGNHTGQLSWASAASFGGGESQVWTNDAGVIKVVPLEAVFSGILVTNNDGGAAFVLVDDGGTVSAGSQSLMGGYVTSGTLTTGKGAIASGRVGVGEISASGSGSLAVGDAFQTGGEIKATADGSVAFGYIDGSDGSIIAGGEGSVAMGFAGLDATIFTDATGAFAWGHTDSGTITASGEGSEAWGGAYSGGTISSESYGSLAFGDADGMFSIVSSGAGSLAHGYTSAGNISASNDGAQAGGSALTGDIESSGAGAFSHGTGNLIASGDGSFVFGDSATASHEYSAVVNLDPSVSVSSPTNSSMVIRATNTFRVEANTVNFTNIPGTGPFVAMDTFGNLFRTNSPASTNVDYINNYWNTNIFNNWSIFNSNAVFNNAVTFKSTVNFSSTTFLSQTITTNAASTVNTNLGAGGALTNFTVNLDGDNNLFLDGGTTNVNLRAMNWAAGLAKTVNLVITNRTATVRTVSFDGITNNWLGMGTITGPISLTNGLYLSIKSMGGTNMWYGAQYTALPTQ